MCVLRHSHLRGYERRLVSRRPKLASESRGIDYRASRWRETDILRDRSGADINPLLDAPGVDSDVLLPFLNGHKVRAFPRSPD